MRVLVVWEPILATDWRAPGARVLGWISDRRARQFWDPNHLVAEQLARMEQQKPGKLEPDCCMKKGFHWDEAILYAPHVRWGDGPEPVFWNGPVYRISASLDKAVSEQP
ncbi:MAG TPA: hypothetical protein VI431_17060 [Candidatus Acidoferrum sp.]